MRHNAMYQGSGQRNAMLDARSGTNGTPMMHDAPQNVPWYQQSNARYGPTNFMLDAAMNLVGKPLYNILSGQLHGSVAAPRDQVPLSDDPNAQPAGRDNAARALLSGMEAGGLAAMGSVGTRLAGTKQTSLDMSQAARMERARQMGFDTERVMYHGTPNEFNEFSLARAGSNTGFNDRSGQSVFLSPDPAEANNYAFGYLGDPTDGGRIIPGYVRGNMKRVEHQKPTHLWEDARLEAIQQARKEGYDGVEWANVYDAGADNQGTTTVSAVFNPSNIRSVNAAFDPAKSGSANLMAANPFTGSLPVAYDHRRRR